MSTTNNRESTSKRDSPARAHKWSYECAAAVIDSFRTPWQRLRNWSWPGTVLTTDISTISSIITSKYHRLRWRETDFLKPRRNASQKKTDRHQKETATVLISVMEEDVLNALRAQAVYLPGGFDRDAHHLVVVPLPNEMHPWTKVQLETCSEYILNALR